MGQIGDKCNCFGDKSEKNTFTIDENNKGMPSVRNNFNADQFMVGNSKSGLANKFELKYHELDAKARGKTEYTLQTRRSKKCGEIKFFIAWTERESHWKWSSNDLNWTFEKEHNGKDPEKWTVVVCKDLGIK